MLLELLITLFLIAEPEVSESATRFQKDANNFVTWRMEGTAVVFEVTAEVASGEWFAIGLSEDKLMANTDVLHLGIDPGTNAAVFSDRLALCTR